jgi:hypothetical protein
MRHFSCRRWAAAVLLVVGWTAPVHAQPTIVLDYTFDTNNFFPVGSQQRAALSAAASALTSRLTDTLGAITPGAEGTWTVSFPNPATGSTQMITDMLLPAHEIRVFAGGRDLAGSTLGSGGPGGFSASGTGTFITSLVRGQSGAAGAAASQTDFAPWGGAITFDTTGPTWNFNHLTNPTGSQADFYSVALHELGHLLGFGTANSFKNLVNGSSLFTGPVATALFGSNPPTTADKGHWAEGTMFGGQEVAMDPSIVLGTRKLFTELDFAGLDDLGWQVTPVPEPASVLGLAAAGLAAGWRLRRRIGVASPTA